MTKYSGTMQFLSLMTSSGFGIPETFLNCNFYLLPVSRFHSDILLEAAELFFNLWSLAWFYSGPGGRSGFCCKGVQIPARIEAQLT